MLHYLLQVQSYFLIIMGVNYVFISNVHFNRNSVTLRDFWEVTAQQAAAQTTAWNEANSQLIVYPCQI